MGFTIKSRLGRGRLVETFGATLEVDGERFDVVVKRPRPELKQDEELGEALIAWGQNQREIDQENIVAVLEVGRTEDGPYVLEELVDGAPLAAVLQVLRKRKRSLTPSIAIGIAEQIASGLVHLHRMGIVHAGLDTGDVLLSYDGEVKISDQRLGLLEAHVDLAAEADIYRAPEVDSVSRATRESDVYSFGLITLEMLIGAAVWTAESMTVAGSVAALKDFTHVGQAQPLLTEDVVSLLEACIARDPIYRCSAAQALEKLRALVSKHGIREEKSTIGELVQALIPPPEPDAAPTMMVDQERAEMIARQHSARVARFEGKSVPLDPDLEKKALTRAIHMPPRPDPLPVQKLAPLPIPKLTPPSVARSRAESVPDVAKVAARAASMFNESAKRFQLIAIAIGALLVLSIAMAVFGGEDARTIRLRISSVPPGADVFVDGSAVGVTPIDQEVEVDGTTVKLRFKLEGYREHHVTIGTDAAELRYEAPLERAE